MRKNDFLQIKSLDEKALVQRSFLLRKEIANAVLDKNMNKQKDLKIIAKKRKDLAQVLTVLRQKEPLRLLDGEREEGK